MQIALALSAPVVLLGVTLLMERVEGHAMGGRSRRLRAPKS